MAIGDDAIGAGFQLVPGTGEAGRVRFGAQEINRTRDYVAQVIASLNALSTKVTGLTYTASGSRVSVPDASGHIVITFGVTFASPVYAVATSGVGAAIIACITPGTTSCTVIYYGSDGSIITSGSRRVNWSATGHLA